MPIITQGHATAYELSFPGLGHWRSFQCQPIVPQGWRTWMCEIIPCLSHSWPRPVPSLHAWKRGHTGFSSSHLQMCLFELWLQYGWIKLTDPLFPYTNRSSPAQQLWCSSVSDPWTACWWRLLRFCAHMASLNHSKVYFIHSHTIISLSSFGWGGRRDPHVCYLHLSQVT